MTRNEFTVFAQYVNITVCAAVVQTLIPNDESIRKLKETSSFRTRLACKLHLY